MATEANILQEFLVSLGFKIDQVGMKKFKNALSDSNKGALAVGGALVGAALAVAKFVTSMADGMEKLYFASDRTGASVTNLKAVEGAFQNIGLAAGKGSSYIENFATSMRMPGMAEFAQNLFGFDPDKMDTVDAYLAAMKQLAENAKKSKIDYQIALGQAENLFGMNDQDFKTTIDHIDELIAGEKERKKIIEEQGANQKQLAKDAHEFNSNLRDIATSIGAIGTAIESKLLPGSKVAAEAARNAAKGDWLGFVKDELRLAVLLALPDSARKEYEKQVAAKDPVAGGAVSEQLLNAQRQVESSGGTQLISRETFAGGKHALGPYQFREDQLAEHGLNRETAMQEGPSREAARQYDQKLLDMFAGDLHKAIVAYTYGPTNVKNLSDQYGTDWEAHLPTRIQKYLGDVLQDMNTTRVGGSDSAAGAGSSGATTTNNHGPTMNLNQTINMQGGDDDSKARALAEQTKRTMGNTLRDMRGSFATPGRS